MPKWKCGINEKKHTNLYPLEQDGNKLFDSSFALNGLANQIRFLVSRRKRWSKDIQGSGWNTFPRSNYWFRKVRIWPPFRYQFFYKISANVVNVINKMLYNRKLYVRLCKGSWMSELDITLETSSDDFDSLLFKFLSLKLVGFIALGMLRSSALT